MAWSVHYQNENVGLKRLAALTGYCVACHAAYRLEETR